MIPEMKRVSKSLKASVEGLIKRKDHGEDRVSRVEER